jgi:Fur family ferric uptake transcriptional regulator
MKIVRKTKSVEILIDAFKNSHNAFSVVDLEQDGVVHSFLGIDGLKWYAKCQNCSSHHHIDAHPHFQCQICGVLDCLSTDITIPPIQNRQIDFAQILLVGKCEKCLS